MKKHKCTHKKDIFTCDCYIEGREEARKEYQKQINGLIGDNMALQLKVNKLKSQEKEE